MIVITSDMHMLMAMSSALCLDDLLRQCQHAEVPRHAHMLDEIHMRFAYTIAHCRSTAPHPPMSMTHPATASPELNGGAWGMSRTSTRPNETPRSMEILPQRADAACTGEQVCLESQERRRGGLWRLWERPGSCIQGFDLRIAAVKGSQCSP
jgi:hypothetical protein